MENLTKRELEVLRLLLKGKTNCEIALHMTVSVNTVKAHMANIFIKLGVRDRVQAAIKALSEGMI